MFSIETERLRLRGFQPDDVPYYYALVHSDHDVMRYITGSALPIERSQAMIERFIRHDAEHGFSVWAVTEKSTGVIVGHGGLITLPTLVEVEVDYGFGKKYWGRGYATEVARAVLRFGLEAANLNPIYALSYPENRASQRVMQKLCMTYEGKSKQFYNVELEIYRISRGELDTAGMVYKVSR